MFYLIVNNYLLMKNYVGKGSYIIQGERFVNLSPNIDDARLYSTKSRAINAMNKLQSTCHNLSGANYVLPCDFDYQYNSEHFIKLVKE